MDLRLRVLTLGRTAYASLDPTARLDAALELHEILGGRKDNFEIGDMILGGEAHDDACPRLLAACGLPSDDPIYERFLSRLQGLPGALVVHANHFGLADRRLIKRINHAARTSWWPLPRLSVLDGGWREHPRGPPLAFPVDELIRRLGALEQRTRVSAASELFHVLLDDTHGRAWAEVLQRVAGRAESLVGLIDAASRLRTGGQAHFPADPVGRHLAAAAELWRLARSGASTGEALQAVAGVPEERLLLRRQAFAVGAAHARGGASPTRDDPVAFFLRDPLRHLSDPGCRLEVIQPFLAGLRLAPPARHLVPVLNEAHAVVRSKRSADPLTWLGASIIRTLLHHGGDAALPDLDLLNHGELLVVIRACPGTALESAVLARIRSGALPLPLEFVRQVVAHASAAPLDWKERLEHVDRTVRPLPRPFIDVAPLLKDGAPDWRSRVPAKLPELAPWEQRRFNIRAAEPEVARLLIASWVDEAATGPTTDLEYGVLAAVLRRAHIAEFLADDEKALSVIAECARRILLARAGNERRFVRSGEVAASALLALLAQCVLLRSLGGEMAPVFSALLAGVQHPVDQNWWPRVRLAAEAAEVDVSSWGPGSPDGVRQLREQLWHLASCQIGQQQSAALEILRCRHHDRGLLIDKLADAFSHWVKNIPGGDTAVPRLARALLAFDACPQSAGDELDEIVPEAERLARITCPARVARITFEGQDDDSGSAMRIPRLPLVLVMAEFIANALEHGSGAEVRVKSPGQHCWIEVECEAEDSLRAASIMNQRPGLGLQLCLALCRHFGYEFAAISDRGVVRMEIKKSETRRRPR